MTTTWPLHGRIGGPIVMIGFGSIGKGTLPLIERHFEFDKSRFVVIDPSDKDRHLLDERGIRFVKAALTRDNYREILAPLLTAGGGQGFCVNLSVDTSSVDIMELARENGALYIDTVNEPWAGFYFDASKGPGARTNYVLREETLAARARNPGGPTAVSCCGANPGMVSWFVKQALLDLARDLAIEAGEPATQRGLGAASCSGSASRASTSPSATPSAPPPRSRCRSSSTPGRSRASSRRACSRPSSAGARTSAGCRTTPARQGRDSLAIYLNQPGANTRVRSWCPTPRPAIRLPRHAQRIDLDPGLLHGARGRQGGVPPDLPLRLPPVQRGGAVAARDVRPGGPGAGARTTS